MMQQQQQQQQQQQPRGRLPNPQQQTAMMNPVAQQGMQPSMQGIPQPQQNFGLDDFNLNDILQ